MKSILSPEQFEKQNALKEKHHERRGNQRGERKEEIKKVILKKTSGQGRKFFFKILKSFRNFIDSLNRKI
jgi:hypothetical protein